MRVLLKYFPAVRPSTAVRRLVLPSLLACVFTLQWAAAQAPAPSAPGAPSDLAAASGNRSIALTWGDPNDGSITGYQFRVHADREPDWREWKSIPGSTHETTGHTLPALTNGVVYRVQVRAYNDAGAGEPAETSAEPQAPSAVSRPGPGAPNGLMATPGDGTIALTWDDPNDLNITGYQFRVHADREPNWREWRSIPGSTSETTDHRLDLTNGVLYRVQVRARNSAGAGEPSETSAKPQAPAVEPVEDTAADAPAAAAPPGAPNGLVATAGDGTILLAWDDPSDASITGYQFRVHADRETDWREWRSIPGSTSGTIDYRLDLTNGVLYRVQVRARNSAGVGEPSEASAEPQAPDGGASSASAGAGTDAPEDGGGAPQSADGSVPSSDGAGESPRSGVPWIVIVVLAVCLAIGITIVAVRLRATSRGGAES